MPIIAKGSSTIFGCRVTDTYGCGEGMQIAVPQCGRNDGAYHIFMPHVALEIVDDHGEPVAPGAVGHIILTRLDPGAMPLIRYRIGDMGVKGPDEVCPCGRDSKCWPELKGGTPTWW